MAVTTATLHDNALAALAINKGLAGATPSQLMKYSLMVFIGYSESEARKVALGYSEPSSLSEKNKFSIRVDDEMLEKAIALSPEVTNMAYRWRLMVALAAGFTEDQVKGVLEMERGVRAHRKTRERESVC